jgi:hypothetical protein
MGVETMRGGTKTPKNRRKDAQNAPTYARNSNGRRLSDQTYGKLSAPSASLIHWSKVRSVLIKPSTKNITHHVQPYHPLEPQH